MAIGLLGRKVGMTQVFEGDGKAVAVTVIQAGPCPVIQKKTADRDGYEAIQIGFGAEAKAARLTRPVRGHFDKVQVPSSAACGRSVCAEARATSRSARS